MHDEPRSDLEERALAAWTPQEPPPDFAGRVLSAGRDAPRARAFPPLGRLVARGGARLAGLLVAAAAAAGLAYAAAEWMASRTGPERPVPSVHIEGGSRDGAPVSAGLPAPPPELATPPTLSLPADLEPQIDRYVAGYGQRYGDAFKFHGVVRVLKDGEVVATRTYGLADRNTGAKNGPDTRFKIGSLTQIFTAAAVLQLRDLGKLDLDAPVRKYIPDYPAVGERITLRHLLSHTSGIPSYTDAAIFTLGTRGGPVEPAAVRAIFQDLPLEFPPGTEFDPSNSGYFLLGQVVEAVSGRAFADYVAEDLLAPAGMRRSGLGTPVDALGYQFDEDEILIPAAQRHASAYGAAAAMVSTADDLAAWDRALRTPGLILSARSLRDMTTEVRDDYGLGWFLRHERGQTLAFYPGGVEGYNATIARFLGDGLTVFALANTEAVDTRTLVYDIARIAHGDPVEPPAEHAEVTLPSAALLARYAGNYVLSETTREALRPLVDADQLEVLERVHVSEDRGRLFMHVPDYGAKWMHPLGEDRFFFKDPSATTAEFGPPGAPVDRLTLHQQGLTFVLRRDQAKTTNRTTPPSPGDPPRI